jgi:hypothetical protein
VWTALPFQHSDFITVQQRDLTNSAAPSLFVCCLFARIRAAAHCQGWSAWVGAYPKIAWPNRRIGAAQTVWNFEEAIPIPPGATYTNENVVMLSSTLAHLAEGWENGSAWVIYGRFARPGENQ